MIFAVVVSEPKQEIVLFPSLNPHHNLLLLIEQGHRLQEVAVGADAWETMGRCLSLRALSHLDLVDFQERHRGRAA